MSKKGKSGSFWDNPFGGLFDFNRDGREDWGEQWLAHMMFEEIKKSSKQEPDDSWRYDCLDGYDYGVDPFDYESVEAYLGAVAEVKYAWRDTCEDGSEYDIDPKNYETEVEYNEALENAKYGWRETCEDGSAYALNPEDYETEDEYNDALDEAKIAWRNDCEDGSEYDLDPEDYETEEEYNEALDEAKIAWRDDCEDGSEYDLDPEDYETEEEYNEALDEAKIAWRETCEDGNEYDLDPEDYETEEEYNEALDEAKTAWRETCEDDSDYALDPEAHETEDEYNEALDEAKTAWQEDCEDGSAYSLDPGEYETEEEYNEALDEAKTAWQEDCEDGSAYGLDPENYETEEEYNEALDEAKTAWREDCEDGSAYDLDPEDYETEEEYEDALAEAKIAWRETCEDGSKYGLDPYYFLSKEEYDYALQEAKAQWDYPLEDEPESKWERRDWESLLSLYEEEDPDDEELEDLDDAFENLEEEEDEEPEELNEADFPNLRRYHAADALATEYFSSERERASAQFILDCADTIIAANYLTYDYGFLYTQAIKDHFRLPFSLPDEDECPTYSLSEAICKTARWDIALSFAVWSWCLDTFMPYAQYAEGSLDEMTESVIYEFYSFPKGYVKDFVFYLDKHPEFLEKVTTEEATIASDLDSVIYTAIENELFETAHTLFVRGLKQAGSNWEKIHNLVNGTISFCKNDDELESAEYFKFHLLPIVKEIPIGMVQDEIGFWEKELDEYIAETERDCEKYAYTRRNAWRKTAPDGSEYGLDPLDYDTEEEYLNELEQEKYNWREWYQGENALELDANDFESEKEYLSACKTERKAQKMREKQQKENRLQAETKTRTPVNEEDVILDDTIYTFCGILFPFTTSIYHYRCEDPSIQIGDKVRVPVGSREAVGIVVSVGQYMRVAAPFSVEQAKFVIEKVQEG